MDKSKQPGISFDGIMLVKEEFWRDYNVPDDVGIDIKFEEVSQIMDNNASVEITSILKLIIGNHEALKLESKFVGLFSTDEHGENMDLKTYIENHSAALMFPYIREHINSVTSKAGINPVMLPPLNLVAILNSNKEKY